jgi:hypothetical protein
MRTSAQPSRHFSMIRGFHLADFVTLGNAACGMAGVFLAMVYVTSGALSDFMWAAAMAPLAFAGGMRGGWGAWEIGAWTLHPLVLMFVLSGTLMISRTLRIPTL